MHKGTILYVGGFELPDRNAAALRVVANGKLFRELGFQVCFLGIEHGEVGTKPILNEATSFSGFKTWSLKYPSRLSEWYVHLCDISTVDGIIDKGLDERPCAIIAYNYPAVALWRLRHYCKRNSIALIADCSEWYEAPGGPVFRIIKSLDTVLRMRWLHPRLDGVITISRYLFEFYKSRTKNVVMLPPLVDLAEEKWKRKDYIPSDTTCLVYAGSPGKGNKDRLDKVIRALSIIKSHDQKNFILRVAGITEEQYIDSFGKDALPDNIRGNIEFRGRLSHTNVIDILKRSDYSIFLRDENLTTMAGFPTKFVESISCGTPVLTNSSSNIADFLVAGDYGYLLDISTDATLADSLAEAIGQPAEQISNMKQFCKSALIFDYHNHFCQMREFMDQVMVKGIIV